MTRFPSAKHAASYIGLVPSTHQSGDRDAHGRITKRGSSELRTLLCEAAQHANRVTNPLNPYFNTLCARRGYKSAVVAIAHRLCRILFAMLRHETEFNIEKLGVEMGPFESKRVRLYRRRVVVVPEARSPREVAVRAELRETAVPDVELGWRAGNLIVIGYPVDRCGILSA